MANKQFVVFEMDGEEYGIDVNAINGILRYKRFPVKKLPSLPPVIEGVINLRGNVNYVYNLRKKFQLPDKPIDIESKIVMLYVNDQIVGYIVDEVTDIVYIQEENIEQSPSFITSIQGEYISGFGKVDERIIVLLDTEKISMS